jgi:single-stranded-DNA-specific exonuclease
LVAGKLCELLHRPVGVFTRDHNNYVGSFRAPVGIDLIKILDAASEYIIRYGGHAGAAGCTIAVDQFPHAHEAIMAATEHLYTMSDFIPTITVDSVIDIERLDQVFNEQIESLRPFGQ